MASHPFEQLLSSWFGLQTKCLLCSGSHGDITASELMSNSSVWQRRDGRIQSACLWSLTVKTSEIGTRCRAVDVPAFVSTGITSQTCCFIHAAVSLSRVGFAPTQARSFIHPVSFSLLYFFLFFVACSYLAQPHSCPPTSHPPI